MIRIMPEVDTAGLRERFRGVHHTENEHYDPVPIPPHVHEIVQREAGPVEIEFSNLVLQTQGSKPREWHVDNNDDQILSSGRTRRALRISAILYLNSPPEFGGGLLEFEHVLIHPARGLLVIFPSTYRHKTSQVTHGERFRFDMFFS